MSIDSLIGVVVGLALGTPFGILLACLMATAKRADREMQALCDSEDCLPPEERRGEPWKPRG